MKVILFLVVVALVQFVASHDKDDARQRAVKLISQMTLDEKILMVHGSNGASDPDANDTNNDNSYVGYTPAISRLGIPALKLNDGPSGFRDDDHTGTTTCFPSALAVATTWDEVLLYKYGKAMGKEFYDKGANVQLGPGVNIARVPYCGRNFEYISGADPHLGRTLVQPLVKGIQSNGVIANAKHWVENNQESNRDTVSANVDERTRFEFYYQPFIGAIEANVGSFMCSYNKIHDVWSCENPETLGDLKKTLGFQGWVMSDWGATHSLSIREGLDQEMPSGLFFGDKLKTAVENGEIPMEVLDDSVLRILTPMFEMGIMDNPNPNKLSNDVKSPEHRLLARELGAKAHVLLKNDDVLPLKTDKPMKIAMIGNARSPIIGGGGSGSIFPSQVVTPYDAMLDYLNIVDPNKHKEKVYDCTVREKGYEIHQWGCAGTPAVSADDCAKQCGEHFNCNYWSFDGDEWCMLYPTQRYRFPTLNENMVTGTCIKPKTDGVWNCNSETNICLAVIDGKDTTAAAELAKEADVALVTIGTFSREGTDREQLSFNIQNDQSCDFASFDQDNLVSVIAGTGTPTIVAMQAPAAVLVPWKDSVKAILHGFFSGEEYGNALVDVLFGRVNPSARLPITIPNTENEIGFTTSQYPGIKLEGNYTEGMLVDYRWYTAHKVKPSYPFGHGLSYTKFSYSDLAIHGNKISFKVKNIGKYDGDDIPQLYLSFPVEANTPPLQLKGFKKTKMLGPGDSETIEYTVSNELLQIWSVEKHDWQIIPGKYGVSIGASSGDLRLVGTYIRN